MVPRNEADIYRVAPGLNGLCRKVVLNSLAAHVSCDHNRDNQRLNSVTCSNL